jgi:hypothetical protein
LQMVRLNTGQEIILADSLDALMRGPFGAWLLFLSDHPEWEDDVMFAPPGLPNIKPGELSARTAATLAFSQWLVELGLAQHPERLPALEQQLKYHMALERQGIAKHKPKLRVIRPKGERA